MKCKSCNCRFVLKKSDWIEQAYLDYTIHKQTFLELSAKYLKSEKTIRKYFDKLATAKNFQVPNTLQVNLTVDTTFFKGKEGFGVTIFRSHSKNLYWNYCETERLVEYEKGFNSVDQKYQVVSVTIDGKKGLKELIQKRYGFQVPVQYCHFHQVATVTRYTTRKPKTECGKELRELILILKNSNKQEFTDKFNKLKQKYKQFLLERNDQGQFQHRRLRSAFRSINTNLAYLFTYQDYPDLNIPKTTNSADGSFGQWKKKIKLHNGIRKHRKQQMINQILGGNYL